MTHRNQLKMEIETPKFKSVTKIPPMNKFDVDPKLKRKIFDSIDGDIYGSSIAISNEMYFKLLIKILKEILRPHLIMGNRMNHINEFS